MKTINAVEGFTTLLLLTFTLTGLATPRLPLPPIPEFASLLYHESFDAPYLSGITNAQVTTDKFTYSESWSGYALQRTGDAMRSIRASAARSTRSPPAKSCSRR